MGVMQNKKNLRMVFTILWALSTTE